jgi:hypothetical protein
MEAWFLADRDKLREFYGQGFTAKRLPKTADVEQVPKAKLLTALEHATRAAKTKGKYHKTKHAPNILEMIRLPEVRTKAASCNRLVTTLAAEIGVHI